MAPSDRSTTARLDVDAALASRFRKVLTFETTMNVWFGKRLPPGGLMADNDARVG
jgi:hypothetical protein